MLHGHSASRASTWRLMEVKSGCSERHIAFLPLLICGNFYKTPFKRIGFTLLTNDQKSLHVDKRSKLKQKKKKKLQTFISTEPRIFSVFKLWFVFIADIIKWKTIRPSVCVVSSPAIGVWAVMTLTDDVSAPPPRCALNPLLHRCSKGKEPPPPAPLAIPHLSKTMRNWGIRGLFQGQKPPPSPLRRAHMVWINAAARAV